MTKIVNSLEDLGKEIAAVKKQLDTVERKLDVIYYFLTAPKYQNVINMENFELKKEAKTDMEKTQAVSLEKAKQVRMDQLKKE